MADEERLKASYARKKKRFTVEDLFSAGPSGDNYKKDPRKTRRLNILEDLKYSSWECILEKAPGSSSGQRI